MNMPRSVIRRFVHVVSWKLGFTLGRRTPTERLEQVVDLLRPITTPWPLIRFGARGDGGYVIPDDVAGVTDLFSPGVAKNWSFEEALSQGRDLAVHMCDRNVDLSQCPFPVESFWIGPYTGDGHVSLADWVAMHASDSTADLILQMDIENAEYLALLACPVDTLRRFRILVVEFHGLDRLLSRDWFELVGLPTFRHLAAHFDVVHIHPNNAEPVDTRSGLDLPRVLEVTYHRKDRLPMHPEPTFATDVIDYPNDPNRRAITLSSSWAPSGRYDTGPATEDTGGA